MATTKTIAQIVEQIRTAIYGREVRENLAQGIETCYSDVTNGKTIAEDAADKLENMTASVTSLEPGDDATISLTEVEGHKHLTFGIPDGEKGDKGDKGDKGNKGDKGDKGDTGAVPNITVGVVSTVSPDSSAGFRFLYSTRIYR